MIKQILTVLFFLTSLVYSQNLYYDTDTTGTANNTEDSITIDLGLDANSITSNYEGGNESRAIAIVLHSTWTNDSLQVYAAIHPDSTYYPVYSAGAVVYEVGTTGSSYIVLKPTIYAGIRYLMLNLPAAEAANRMYTVVRRQYWWKL